MRWLACVILLAGCLRARATAVHPTGIERVNGGPGSPGAITRGGTPLMREVPQQPTEASTNLASLELGAMVTFNTPPDSPRVHLAPGVRIFGANSVLFGVAVGTDFVNRRRGSGLALEGSVHAGGGDSNDPTTIQVALDMFAGVTLHSRYSAVAIGPSIGLLGMPGGHSVVMLGLGLRVTGGN
jgi:hypothetical protein